MDIRQNGSAPTKRAPADWFTGTVWQEPVIDSPTQGNVRATYVHFEPGGRTNWHTHPAGQTLYILHGTGRVQNWGGKVREVLQIQLQRLRRRVAVVRLLRQRLHHDLLQLARVARHARRRQRIAHGFRLS